MYNINFNKYTIDELKDFEKELFNAIKTKEKGEKSELLINIIQALKEFDKKFPGTIIAEFVDECYCTDEIINELERYNEDILEEEI